VLAAATDVEKFDTALQAWDTALISNFSTLENDV